MRQRKHAMLGGAAVLAMLSPFSAATAQDATGEQTCLDENADGQCDDAVETAANDQPVITVSGTRIRTSEYDFANPVVAIDDTAI